MDGNASLRRSLTRYEECALPVAVRSARVVRATPAESVVAKRATTVSPFIQSR